MIAGEVARRASDATSAYSLVLSWHRELRDITMARKAVTDAISLPVGVEEIRREVSGRGVNVNAEARKARSWLERSYRAKLFADIGPIYPDDPRPLKQILKVVRGRSRALRPELLDELASAVWS